MWPQNSMLTRSLLDFGSTRPKTVPTANPTAAVHRLITAIVHMHFM